MSTRQKIDHFLLRAARAYTMNFPIDRGKYRLITSVLDAVKDYPAPLLITTADGRRLWADLSTGMHSFTYFLGRYEPSITNIAAALINAGDVCLDVGANFGWYTTLMAERCGPTGRVHSFEPVPSTFDELSKNVELCPHNALIRLNNIALGDRSGEIEINLFESLPTGHASLAATGGASKQFRCKIMSLDEYLERYETGDVDFVKVDIEGAELMFLTGSERLFRQERPPVILMEMALEQLSKFGYNPNDLINFIRSRGDYLFYRVDEAQRKMFEFKAFSAGDIGANVFCIPRGRRVGQTIERFIG